MVGPLEEIPIDDVDAHLQGDARQHSEGNRGCERGSGQDNHHQNHCPDNARQGRTSTGLNVDHGAHGGSSSRQPSKEARSDVGQSLAYQFLV